MAIDPALQARIQQAAARARQRFAERDTAGTVPGATPTAREAPAFLGGQAYGDFWDRILRGIGWTIDRPGVRPVVNVLGQVADRIDRPAQGVRSVLTAQPERMGTAAKGLLPWPLGKLAADDPTRTSGADVLDRFGLDRVLPRWRGPDPYEIAALGVEIFTDPLTYLGVGLATRAGKAVQQTSRLAKEVKGLEQVAEAARVAREAAETLAKNTTDPLVRTEQMYKIQHADDLARRVEPQIGRLRPALDRLEAIKRGERVQNPTKLETALMRARETAAAKVKPNRVQEALEWGGTWAEQAERGQRALIGATVPFGITTRKTLVAGSKQLERLEGIKGRIVGNPLVQKLFPVGGEVVQDLKDLATQVRYRAQERAATIPEMVEEARQLQKMIVDELGPRDLLTAQERELFEGWITDDPAGAVQRLRDWRERFVEGAEALEREVGVTGRPAERGGLDAARQGVRDMLAKERQMPTPAPKVNYTSVPEQWSRQPMLTEWSDGTLRVPGNEWVEVPGYRKRKSMPQAWRAQFERIRPNQAGGELVREVRRLTDEVIELQKVGRRAHPVRTGYLAPKKALAIAKENLRRRGLDPDHVPLKDIPKRADAPEAAAASAVEPGLIPGMPAPPPLERVIGVARYGLRSAKPEPVRVSSELLQRKAASKGDLRSANALLQSHGFRNAEDLWDAVRDPDGVLKVAESHPYTFVLRKNGRIEIHQQGQPVRNPPKGWDDKALKALGVKDEAALVRRMRIVRTAREQELESMRSMSPTPEALDAMSDLPAAGVQGFDQANLKAHEQWLKVARDIEAIQRTPVLLDDPAFVNAARINLGELNTSITLMDGLIDRLLDIENVRRKQRILLDTALANPEKIENPAIRKIFEAVNEFQRRGQDLLEDQQAVITGAIQMREAMKDLGESLGEDLPRVMESLINVIEAPMYERLKQPLPDGVNVALRRVGEGIAAIFENNFARERARGVAGSRTTGYFPHVATEEGIQFINGIRSNESFWARFVALAHQRFGNYEYAKDLLPDLAAEAGSAKSGMDLKRLFETMRKAPGATQVLAKARKALPAEVVAFLDENSLWGEVLQFHQWAYAGRHASQLPRNPLLAGLPLTEINRLFRDAAADVGVRGPENFFTTDLATAVATRQLRTVGALMGADMRDAVKIRYGRQVDVDAPLYGLSGDELEKYGQILVQRGMLTAEALPEWLKARRTELLDKPAATAEGLIPRPDGLMEIPAWNRELVRSGELPAIFDPEIAEAAWSAYKRLTDPVEIPYGLGTLHKLTNYWKGSLTSIWPAFHFRNAMWDQTQSLYGGVTPMGPAYYNSLAALLGRWARSNQSTKFQRFTKFLEREVHVAEGKRTFDQLLDEAQQHGVLKQGFWLGEIGEALRQTTPRQQGGKIKQALRPLNPLSMRDFALFKVGRQVGEANESLGRFAHYLDRRIKGDLPADAAREVRKYRFDYNDLTKAERDWGRLIVPFYTWMTRNTALQAETLFTKPGMIAAQMHMAGLKQSRPEDHVLPEWMQETVRFAVGGGRQGTQAYLIAGGAPVEDFLRNFGPAATGSPVRSLQRLLSQTNPLIKMGIEVTTNRDLFSGRTIDESDQAYSLLGKLPTAMQRAIGYEEEVTRSGARFARADPWKLYALRNLPGLSRAYSTAGRMERSTLPPAMRAVEALTGLKFAELDLQRETQKRTREQFADLVRGERRATGGIRSGEYVYVPKDAQVYGKRISERTRKAINKAFGEAARGDRRALEKAMELLERVRRRNRRAA